MYFRNLEILNSVDGNIMAYKADLERDCEVQEDSFSICPLCKTYQLEIEIKSDGICYHCIKSSLSLSGELQRTL